MRNMHVCMCVYIGNENVDDEKKNVHAHQKIGLASTCVLTKHALP